MNVRRFTAPDISEALSLVRRNLGEDAVILRTRKVRRGGLLSFLSREIVEITAASPDRKPAPDSPPSDRTAQVRRELQGRQALEEIRGMREDISELKGNLQELAERAKFERMPSLPPHLAQRYRDLVKAGLDQKSAKQLTQEVNLRLKGEQLEERALVDRELAGLLSERIAVRRPPLSAGDRARIIVLVGPTGVGKTTTMAKLVTSYRFWGKMETALVSADTYRVAALEQLKTFAAIAGLALEVVYQPAAMKNVLARHMDKAAVFIDTAGRSQADAEKLGELAGFLEAAQPDEVLLCLAVSTRLEDQLDVIKRYQRLNPTGIIFTKLDESRAPGSMLSVLERCTLPAVYLTCGQSVPDDILAANASRLAHLVLEPDRLSELQRTHFESWIEAERGASV